MSRLQSADPHSQTNPTSVRSSSASLPRSMSSLMERNVASLRAIRSLMSVDIGPFLFLAPQRRAGQEREVAAEVPAAVDERGSFHTLDELRGGRPGAAEHGLAERLLATPGVR